MTDKGCSIEGCAGTHFGRTLCASHYHKLRRAGALPPRVTTEERFWAKVDKREPDECWSWTGTLTFGYGNFYVSRGRYSGAHRFAYELLCGQVPEGKALDHMCHNRRCVNPAHLQVVTHQQNAENNRGAQSNSTSGVRGVHWHARSQRWHAKVQHKGVHYYGGSFATVEEAAGVAVALRNELMTNNLLDRQAAS